MLKSISYYRYRGLRFLRQHFRLLRAVCGGLFIAVFLLITLSASPIRPEFVRKFMVVWNVGQGQWVTSVEGDVCKHFDTGGEKFPWKKLKTVCGDKENQIFLSHWDWDHVGALAKWPSSWRACIALYPRGPASDHKKRILDKFVACKPLPGADEPSIWHAISETGKNNFTEEKIENRKLKRISKNKDFDSNATSNVVGYHLFLMSGDSPHKQEQRWKDLNWIKSTKVFVLGHHGSKTSTSQGLLDKLPHIQMSVASARWARYKHPHAETVALLRKNKIPVLKTEDWGNIWFEM